MKGFVAGVCATLAIEMVLAVAVVFGAWKYDSQKE